MKQDLKLEGEWWSQEEGISAILRLLSNIQPDEMNTLNLIREHVTLHKIIDLSVKQDDIEEIIWKRIGQTGERTPEVINSEIQEIEREKQNSQERMNALKEQRADLSSKLENSSEEKEKQLKDKE